MPVVPHPPAVHHPKEPGSISSMPSPLVLASCCEVPLRSCLFSRLNKSWPYSLTAPSKCSSPWPSWWPFSVLPSTDENLSCSGKHELDTASRCGLLGLSWGDIHSPRSAGCAPGNTAWDAAMWGQARCGLMFSSLPTESPRGPFLAELLSSLTVPCTAVCVLQGVLLFQVRESTLVTA